MDAGEIEKVMLAADEDEDDDIVPGPLDEEDAGSIGEEGDEPGSDSVPSEDEAPDVDDGDPDSATVPMKDPLIVDS